MCNMSKLSKSYFNKLFLEWCKLKLILPMAFKSCILGATIGNTKSQTRTGQNVKILDKTGLVFGLDKEINYLFNIFYRVTQKWLWMLFLEWRIQNHFLKNFWPEWNDFGLIKECKNAFLVPTNTNWMTLPNSKFFFNISKRLYFIILKYFTTNVAKLIWLFKTNLKNLSPLKNVNKIFW